MKPSFSGIFSTIFIVGCVGAGCEAPKILPSTKPDTTSVASSERTETKTRISEPTLGFSYVPLTTDLPVLKKETVDGTQLIFGYSNDSEENFRSADLIQQIHRQPGESMQDAVSAIMKKHGGSQATCSHISSTSTKGLYDWLPGGLSVVTLTPKTTKHPTIKEIYAQLRASDYPKSTDTELKNSVIHRQNVAGLPIV